MRFGDNLLRTMQCGSREPPLDGLNMIPITIGREGDEFSMQSRAVDLEKGQLARLRVRAVNFVCI